MPARGHLQRRLFNRLVVRLDRCNGGLRPRCGNRAQSGDRWFFCGGNRSSAHEKRRGMTSPLPNERIEEDCGGRRDEKTGGENAQIAPAPPPCPAGTTPSCGKQLFPQMFQFRSRFGQNKIMIGGGQDFTQFSSPSFACKGHADQEQASARSSLSWRGFQPWPPNHGNRAADGHERWFLCPVHSPP